MGREVRIAIPPATPVSACKSCGAGIYWVKTAAGKNMPVDPGGQPHWASCPHANEHRRPRT